MQKAEAWICEGEGILACVNCLSVRELRARVDKDCSREKLRVSIDVLGDRMKGETDL